MKTMMFFFLFQALLAEEPPESVSQVVSCKTEGKTPLVMACRNGHLGVVEYLVDRCNADIEQSGQGNTGFLMIALLFLSSTSQ